MLAIQPEIQFCMYLLVSLPYLSTSLRLLHSMLSLGQTSDRLVAKVAKRALQLDSVSEPNQLTVVIMKLTDDTF